MEQVIALMPNASSFSPVLKELTYIHEENLTKTEFGGSEFGGYPSLSQRNDSYDVRDTMRVYCGYDLFTGQTDIVYTYLLIISFYSFQYCLWYSYLILAHYP